MKTDMRICPNRGSCGIKGGRAHAVKFRTPKQSHGWIAITVEIHLNAIPKSHLLCFIEWRFFQTRLREAYPFAGGVYQGWKAPQHAAARSLRRTLAKVWVRDKKKSCCYLHVR
jgi:hypothetical protein